MARWTIGIPMCAVFLSLLLLSTGEHLTWQKIIFPCKVCLLDVINRTISAVFDAVCHVLSHFRFITIMQRFRLTKEATVFLFGSGGGSFPEEWKEPYLADWPEHFYPAFPSVRELLVELRSVQVSAHSNTMENKALSSGEACPGSFYATKNTFLALTNDRVSKILFLEKLLCINNKRQRYVYNGIIYNAVYDINSGVIHLEEK